MALSRVQTTALELAAGSPLTTTHTFGSNVTAGNAIFLIIGNNGTSNRTYVVSDNVMGTTGWVRAVARSSVGERQSEIWVNENHTGGAVTITITHNSGAQNFATVAEEWTGFNGDVILDTYDRLTESVASDNHTCSTSGVTSANEVLALCSGFFTGLATSTTPGSGYARFGSTSNGQYLLGQTQVFSTGCTNEVGAWSSSGTDRLGISIIALFSGGGASGYSITANVGSFTLTGIATGLLAQRLLTAAQATFTLTGIAVNFVKGFLLSVTHATFALTGTATNFLLTRLLTASAATFTLTGVASNLLKGFLLTASQSTFTLTGVAVNFSLTRLLTAAAASFTLTGNAANLLKGFLLSAAQATFTLTGIAADFIYSTAGAFVLTAVTATFTLTGNATNLLVTRLLTAASASYTFTANAASLLKGFLLTATQGSFTLTGIAITFLRSYVLVAASTTYTLTGIAVNFIYSAGQAAKHYYTGGIAAAKRMFRGMGW